MFIFLYASLRVLLKWWSQNLAVPTSNYGSSGYLLLQVKCEFWEYRILQVPVLLNLYIYICIYIYSMYV